MKWFPVSIAAFYLVILLTPSPDLKVGDKLDYFQPVTGSPILPPISADWVATDALGRTLPAHNTVGNFRSNKYVGIFYFLLQGQYNDKGVYDISASVKANPTNPKFGPETAWHWWGQPEAGYYKSDDPWVIRRNLQLLTLAGVDILFLDTTNGDTYLPIVSKLCEISVEMRRVGIPTPYICFVTYTKSSETATTIYQQFYAQNRYSELWFRWQGKPLILGKIEEVTDPTVRDFFTWRFSWAWTNARNDPRNWQWIDRTPQNYGWDKDPSVPEQIPVSVASHPFDNNIGKSYKKGKPGTLNKVGITPITGQGVYFDEQWKQALQVDPSVVFVTGWNEWVAQRFVNRIDPAKQYKFMGRPMSLGQSYFIDLYNEEYNRDIEPMKGGYVDNYYYQLVANVRKFKGLPPPETASKSRTVPIDGKFTEWNDIKPAYIDCRGDIAHRKWPRSDNQFVYKNATGRNDIFVCRVAQDNKNVYFYSKTLEKLSPSTGKNWMLLYVDADQSAKTGWMGYDFLINQKVTRNQSTVSKWNGQGWVEIGKIPIQFFNNELELSVPLKTINQVSGRVKLDFHWADNIQRLSDITEFFVNGDSAPDRRFNYRYNSR